MSVEYTWEDVVRMENRYDVFTHDTRKELKDVEYVVSMLNCYLETHDYLFDGLFCGDIVSNYGFGYDPKVGTVEHWVEGGDIEHCPISVDDLKAMVDGGLSDEQVRCIMDRCAEMDVGTEGTSRCA